MRATPGLVPQRVPHAVVAGVAHWRAPQLPDDAGLLTEKACIHSIANFEYTIWPPADVGVAGRATASATRGALADDPHATVRSDKIPGVSGVGGDNGSGGRVHKSNGFVGLLFMPHPMIQHNSFFGLVISFLFP